MNISFGLMNIMINVSSNWIQPKRAFSSDRQPIKMLFLDSQSFYISFQCAVETHPIPISLTRTRKRTQTQAHTRTRTHTRNTNPPTNTHAHARTTLTHTHTDTHAHANVSLVYLLTPKFSFPHCLSWFAQWVWCKEYNGPLIFWVKSFFTRLQECCLFSSRDEKKRKILSKLRDSLSSFSSFFRTSFCHRAI